MDKKLSDQLKNKLVAFGQRRLKRGELFLLAKAISDTLSIGAAMPDNIRTHTLNMRGKIDHALFNLTDYIYLPMDDMALVYTLIDNLLLWRMTVAFQPGRMLFSGEPNNVVDEVTGILRFVDVKDICSVSDIAQNATVIADIFQDYVQSL